VSPTLANAPMLDADQHHLLHHVHLPSGTSWVFSSLHANVGLYLVGAGVGDYLDSSHGVGYLIRQAEAYLDINTVMPGLVVFPASALALDSLVGRIEARLMKWQPHTTETGML